MFDSKKLLEMLIQGAVQPRGGQQGGGIGDLIGQVLGGGQPKAGAAPQGGGGLGDLLGQVLGGGAGGHPSQAGAGGMGGGLGGLLGGLLGGQQGGAAPGGQSGGLGDILGSLLGQAAGGARDAARDVDQATGARDKLEEAITQATGKKPTADMLQQIQDYISQNKIAAGAAAGGLGGVLLGTQAGRSATATAIKLGGLALIGGLAYRAYQNYLQGKPLVNMGEAVREAPDNSAFSPEAGDSHQNAVLMLRGMIAAAAADGAIDEAEKKAILGNVQAQGMDQATMKFLNNEVQNPADAATLAAEVQGPEQATALYTACRLAISVDNRQERRFMDDLAEALGLDEQLVSQIEASTKAVKA